MKKLGLAFLAAVIMMSGVILARAQDSISTERTALAKELFEAMGGKQQFKATMSAVMAPQQEETKRMMDDLSSSYKTVTPAEKAMIAKMTSESIERIKGKVEDFFETKADFDKFINDAFVPTYAKHFTDDELRDMIAFYRSPTGQKMIKEGPQMMVEIMPAMTKTLMPALFEFMNQTRDEEMTALKQKLPKKKITRKTQT